MLIVAIILLATTTRPCPWVTDEEREDVRGRVCAYDIQPGKPEGDAKRFYTNPEKNLRGQALPSACKYGV